MPRRRPRRQESTVISPSQLENRLRKRQHTVSHILGKAQFQDLLQLLQRQGRASLAPGPPLGADELTVGEISVRTWKWQCKRWDQQIKALYQTLVPETVEAQIQAIREREDAEGIHQNLTHTIECVKPTISIPECD